MPKDTQNEIAPEKVVVALVEAAIQKLDQNQPEQARALLVDLRDKLKPPAK